MSPRHLRERHPAKLHSAAAINSGVSCDMKNLHAAFSSFALRASSFILFHILNLFSRPLDRAFHFERRLRETKIAGFRAQRIDLA